jgi:lycopene beta-cyclase
MSAVNVAIIGGGLTGCLLALRLSQARPELNIMIIDRRPVLGGEQMWSFHETDVTQSAMAWLAPMIVKRWEAQDIIFPSRQRRMNTAYCTMTSDSLRQELQRHPSIRHLTGIEVTEFSAQSVRLADGAGIEASLVVDARGYAPTKHAANAFQKFLGTVVTVKGGHGVDVPLIMDANVPQIDGFRFVYLLPLDAERIMVEDTRYSDGALLDLKSMEMDLNQYISAKRWQITEESHREHGVLPITLFYDAARFWAEIPADGAVPIGMRAGLFHATTGYSFPLAVQTADMIAAAVDLSSAAIMPVIRKFATDHARRQAYFRYLNRMMFKGCPPERRWFIMQRFYGLGAGLIERFYADRLLITDQMRILVGKPPIPIYQGLRCMPEVADLTSVAA